MFQSTFSWIQKHYLIMVAGAQELIDVYFLMPYIFLNADLAVTEDAGLTED